VLVGTDPARIVAEASRLLRDPAEYARRSALRNPYGDGAAAGRIRAILEREPL
jgi:UDP-N-acetylglucosamine 2-epimerase (non-hydrolysing)